MDKKQPIPSNEEQRLMALKSYNIMDTLPEDVYDNITKLASIICETPIALISLLDENKQWFKSEVGLGAKETPRNISFCQHAIMGDQVFEVPNALENSIFSDNPLVTDNPNIRFYAGAPLKDEDGYNLGTLCVIHTEPKKLNESQKEALLLLSKEVISQFTLRRRNAEFREIENYYNKSLDLICVAGHDGYFKKINNRFTDLLGYTKEELLKSPFFDYIHKEDLQNTAEVIKQISKGEVVYSFNNRFKCKNGDYKHISWNADTDVETGNMLAVGRDITEEVVKNEKFNDLFRFQNTVLDGTDYSIIATEIDGTITVFNKGAENLLGYTKEEVINKTSPAIFHDENEVVKRAEQLSQELKQTITPGFDVFVIKSREGKPDVNEWTYITKSGERVPVELSVTALFNSKEEITGYLGVAKNLTEQKAKAKEIAELTEALNTEVKAINDSVLRVEIDTNGKIIDVNNNFCNLIKYDVDSLLNIKHSDLIPKEKSEQESYKKFWDELLKGKSQHGLFKRITKTNKEVWIRGSYIPLKNNKQEVIKIIKIAYDVTKSIQLQEEVKEALISAKQATAAKDEFLANMSHEIRTPMNAIVGFTELIESTDLTKEQVEYLSSIKSASTNLLTIINDILDFAKIESGQLTLNPHPFEINEILNSTKKTLKSLAQQKGLELKFYNESEIILPVYGDAGRLNQVLINLIGNAIKFTEHGKVEVYTTLLKETELYYEINFKVKDTGIGIAKENLDKIFSRFKQAEKYTTRKYGGTGLGLSISKRILEALGGELTVKSELGEGSEFSFDLTLSKAEEVQKKQAESIEEEAISLKEIKVLLVEDNVLNQVLAKQILTKVGVILQVAENGQIGIDMLKANPDKYDMILMDLQMPVMSGYEATTYIRNNLKLNIPIIAMTAHSLVGEEKKCRDLGMNEYISKPYKAKELINKLQKFVDKDKRVDNDNILDSITELSEGNQEFMNEMISIFLKNGQADIELLSQASERGDFNEVAKIAHKLKSSFGIFRINNGFNLLTKLNEIESYKKQEDILKDVELLKEISKSVFETLKARI